MPFCLHVIPDRLGRWRVHREGDEQPLSHHTNETDAERAATRHARELGVGEVVVHDRYQRTRTTAA